MTPSGLARDVLDHCIAIAHFSDVPGQLTRTYLSDATRSCQAYLATWMERLGLHVHTDSAGNLRGLYDGLNPLAGRVLIGSHLDTVPNAGKYDGVLGVVLALGLIEGLAGERLQFAIEVIGFSEEEGVRFSTPFIGSRALAGDLDRATLQILDTSGVSIEGAIRKFGIDPDRLAEAMLARDARAYIEFHIEQGPVLDSVGLPLAVVENIVGQSRASVKFVGRANHAGTTPMSLRKDALCAAAEWICCVERQARADCGLVATVGKIESKSGAVNVVPGDVTLSLDVRHSDDLRRSRALATILDRGERIAHERELHFESSILLHQDAVPMDLALTRLAERAISAAGVQAYRMSSGAGHDAMILARKLPCGMIFLRTPGGISHHPDETVLEEDVSLALEAGVHLLRQISACHFHN